MGEGLRRPPPPGGFGSQALTCPGAGRDVVVVTGRGPMPAVTCRLILGIGVRDAYRLTDNHYCG